ncbi:hypothetical protein IWQ57_007053, partial [Coemansia nantahalensis]
MVAAAAIARRDAQHAVSDVPPVRQQPAPVAAAERERRATVDAIQQATGFYETESMSGNVRVEYSSGPRREPLLVQHQSRAGTPVRRRHRSGPAHAHASAMEAPCAIRVSHVVGSPTTLSHVPPGCPDYGECCPPTHRDCYPVHRNGD